MSTIRNDAAADATAINAAFANTRFMMILPLQGLMAEESESVVSIVPPIRHSSRFLIVLHSAGGIV